MGVVGWVISWEQWRRHILVPGNVVLSMLCDWLGSLELSATMTDHRALVADSSSRTDPDIPSDLSREVLITKALRPYCVISCYPMASKALHRVTLIPENRSVHGTPCSVTISEPGPWSPARTSVLHTQPGPLRTAGHTEV